MARARKSVSLLDILRSRKSNPGKRAARVAAPRAKAKSVSGSVPAAFRPFVGKQSAGFKQYQTLRKKAAAMGLRFKRGAIPDLAALKAIVAKGPSGIVKSNPRRPARRR